MATSPLPGSWGVSMWGMSPACDLLELIDKKKLGPSSDLDKKEINILLIGQSDIRHSLQTLKTHWRILKENDFYVVENCVELFARQMLFWKMAFEPTQNELERHDKVKQFGEVHGNSMVRPETWETVTHFSKSLISMLTDGSNSPQHFTPCFDFSQLKGQEQNRMVEIIKFWKHNSSDEQFDMSLQWNNRCRQYLGAEYQEEDLIFNHQHNYHENIITNGVSIIDSMEYAHFRNFGYGFRWWKDGYYTQPNLTLVSNLADTPGFHEVGNSYWGDIVTGPFICHGVECEDPSAFKRVTCEMRRVYEVKRSSDIAIRNLHDIFSVFSNDPLPDPESTSDNNEPIGQNQNPDVTIHFVSMSNFCEFPSNPKYKEFFDVAYFGNTMMDHLNIRLSPIFAPDAILLAENARYAYDLPHVKKELSTAKINEVATDIGFKPIRNFNTKNYQYDNRWGVHFQAEIKPCILKYVMKSENNNEKFTDFSDSIISNLLEIPMNMARKLKLRLFGQ